MAEGLRFYLDYKLSGEPARFMGAGRKHKTPGSKTKGFITHSTAGGMSSRSQEFSLPLIPRGHHKAAHIDASPPGFATTGDPQA